MIKCTLFKDLETIYSFLLSIISSIPCIDTCPLSGLYARVVFLFVLFDVFAKKLASKEFKSREIFVYIH